MKFDKIHNKGRAQIFKNRYLEYLTRTHPLIIWGLYLPIIIYLPWYASTKSSLSFLTLLFIFLAGVVFWTFFEYIIHRFVFHWISENPRTKRIAYVLHGNHHEFPRDRQRLFMPAAPSLLAASLIFMIMYVILGYIAFAFFPGFILGYLFYASIHYAIHAWNPPFKWMKPIWRNHHLHHYRNDEKGFGVSTPIWDKVFDTAFDLKQEKENKEAVTNLMFEKRIPQKIFR